MGLKMLVFCLISFAPKPESFVPFSSGVYRRRAPPVLQRIATQLTLLDDRQFDVKQSQQTL
jgi:hypothetical protein